MDMFLVVHVQVINDKSTIHDVKYSSHKEHALPLA